MFWKKKKNDIITVELDSDDRRNSVRITPSEHITIQHNEKLLELIDISSTGVSFKMTADDAYQTGELLDISFQLPLSAQQLSEKHLSGSLVSCSIKIMRISNLSCHCQLSRLEGETQKLLDFYILIEQKKQIRKQHSFS